MDRGKCDLFGEKRLARSGGWGRHRSVVSEQVGFGDRLRLARAETG